MLEPLKWRIARAEQAVDELMRDRTWIDTAEGRERVRRALMRRAALWYREANGDLEIQFTWLHSALLWRGR